MEFFSSSTIISSKFLSFGKKTESICFKTFYKKAYGPIDCIESSGMKYNESLRLLVIFTTSNRQVLGCGLDKNKF
jgi:hypothetical protein